MLGSDLDADFHKGVGIDPGRSQGHNIVCSFGGISRRCCSLLECFKQESLADLFILRVDINILLLCVAGIFEVFVHIGCNAAIWQFGKGDPVFSLVAEMHGIATVGTSIFLVDLAVITKQLDRDAWNRPWAILFVGSSADFARLCVILTENSACSRETN